MAINYFAKGFADAQYELGMRYTHGDEILPQNTDEVTAVPALTSLADARSFDVYRPHVYALTRRTATHILLACSERIDCV